MLSLVTLGILITVMTALISESSLIMVPFYAVSAFLILFGLYRFGLLASIAPVFVAHLYVFFPITTDFTAWYACDFHSRTCHLFGAGRVCGVYVSRRIESICRASVVCELN